MWRILVVLALAACPRRAPTPRERALEHVPGGAQVVASADATALADPGVRRALDAARTHVGESFGCVIDAALDADAAALAATRTTGAVVALASHVAPRNCPALSRISDDIWIATIGDATPAPAREASVLAVSRWARARDYLVHEPLALAIDIGALHAVAAARPHPLDGWLAIDASSPAATSFEREALAALHSWRAGSAAAGAGKLELTRTGDQVVVRAHAIGDDELATLARAFAAAIDAPPPPPARPPLACPTGVTRCVDASHYEVVTVADRLLALAAPSEPVVSAGAIVGLRLTADADFLLRRGDILLGIDGSPVRSPADLQRAAARVHRVATIAFRRDGADFVVHLAGANE